MRIHLTTNSFQDTPGPHHDLLAGQSDEIVLERGPLPESRMLELTGDFDALLCGDNAITRAVLEKSLPRLKVVAKYGIGLDKVDVAAATDLKIPVTFCPGVNHTTVAEHTFGLLLAIYRHIVEEDALVHGGQWKRLTGHELMGKTIGIAGLGRIGKEVATRSLGTLQLLFKVQGTAAACALVGLALRACFGCISLTSDLPQFFGPGSMRDLVGCWGCFCCLA